MYSHGGDVKLLLSLKNMFEVSNLQLFPRTQEVLPVLLWCTRGSLNFAAIGDSSPGEAIFFRITRGTNQDPNLLASEIDHKS